MSDAPELVIDAPPPRGLLLVVGAATLAALVVVPLAVWLSPARQAIDGPGAVCLMLLPGVALGAAPLALQRWYDARYGRVELHADRVVIRRGPVTRVDHAVPWSEVVGYRDHAATHVELVHATGRGSELRLPTPTLELRTALLALLDRRGLRRLD